MKLILFLSLIGFSMALPTLFRNKRQADDQSVIVLRQETDGPGPDGYRFNYELSDGTRREEEAYLSQDGFIEKRGSYSFIDPNGEEVKVNWVADRFGFRLLDDGSPGGSPLFELEVEEPQILAAPILLQKGR